MTRLQLSIDSEAAQKFKMTSKISNLKHNINDQQALKSSS